MSVLFFYLANSFCGVPVISYLNIFVTYFYLKTSIKMSLKACGSEDISVFEIRFEQFTSEEKSFESSSESSPILLWIKGIKKKKKSATPQYIQENVWTFTHNVALTGRGEFDCDLSSIFIKISLVFSITPGKCQLINDKTAPQSYLIFYTAAAIILSRCVPPFWLLLGTVGKAGRLLVYCGWK